MRANGVIGVMQIASKAITIVDQDVQNIQETLDAFKKQQRRMLGVNNRFNNRIGD